MICLLIQKLYYNYTKILLIYDKNVNWVSKLRKQQNNKQFKIPFDHF